MSDQRPSDVLGALPRRRPHRRSDKRPSPAPAGKSPADGRREEASLPAAASSPDNRLAAPAPSSTPPAPATALPRAAPHTRPQRLRQPAQPAGGPPKSPERRPAQPTGRHILGTAVGAAAELAEIGLSVGARAVRNAVSRLPRP